MGPAKKMDTPLQANGRSVTKRSIQSITCHTSESCQSYTHLWLFNWDTKISGKSLQVYGAVRPLPGVEGGGSAFPCEINIYIYMYCSHFLSVALREKLQSFLVCCPAREIYIYVYCSHFLSVARKLYILKHENHCGSGGI